jgi:hypothetical protein
MRLTEFDTGSTRYSRTFSGGSDAMIADVTRREKLFFTRCGPQMTGRSANHPRPGNLLRCVDSLLLSLDGSLNLCTIKDMHS